MRPENVNPQNFTVDRIIFNNKHYSVCYGHWKNEPNTLAMRWNGDINKNSDLGYPYYKSTPYWFVVDRSLMIVILKGLLDIQNSDKDRILDILKTELK